MNIFDYKWWWEKIGGRPWTYILRDAWHNAEFFWLVGLVSLGIWLGHTFTFDVVIKGWLIFSVGYLFGHLFWGTSYIRGQKGR